MAVDPPTLALDHGLDLPVRQSIRGADNHLTIPLDSDGDGLACAPGEGVGDVLVRPPHDTMSRWRTLASAVISVTSSSLHAISASILVNRMRSERAPLSLLTSGPL